MLSLHFAYHYVSFWDSHVFAVFVFNGPTAVSTWIIEGREKKSLHSFEAYCCGRKGERRGGCILSLKILRPISLHFACVETPVVWAVIQIKRSSDSDRPSGHAGVLPCTPVPLEEKLGTTQLTARAWGWFNCFGGDQVGESQRLQRLPSH